MANKKKFALVKWVNEQIEGKDTYSDDIPIDLIKGFDYDKFKSGSIEYVDKIYPVEWRTGNEPRLGGWDVFDAKVIAASHSKKELANILNSFDGLKSPRSTEKLPKTAKERNLNAIDLASSSSYSGDANMEDQKQNEDITLDDDASDDHSDSPPPKRRNIEKTNASNDKNVITTEDLKKALMEVKRKDDNQEQSQEDVNLVSKSRKNEKTELFIEHFATPIDKYKRIPHKIELGLSGSGVLIDYPEWRTIKTKSTYKAMTSALLVALFPMAVLLESNYKGGISKIEPTTAHKKALDRHIMTAISITVEHKFKGSFKMSEFGKTVDDTLGRIRRKMQPKNKENKASDD